MRSNDFRVDTTPSASPSILRRRQTLLGLALLLTIPQMINAVYLPIRWALDAKAGAALNIAHLASNELYFLVMSIAGAAVLKIMLSDATFSRTLVRCTRAEGILLAAAAAVFPFLPGYTSSGSTFFFFDAALLLPGVLLLILAELLAEAFALQTERNEIL